MATAITWPPIGGVGYSIPAAGEVGWPALSNFLIALSSAQGTSSQKVGTRTATSTPVSIVSSTDCVVISKMTVPSAVAVNLATGVDGQYICLIDGTGDASTNPITITASGSETINGIGSIVLDVDYGSIVLVFKSGAPNGNWSIMSFFSTEVGGTVARSDIAPGTADYVVINDNSGLLSEEQYLSQVRGGFGDNVGAFTGVVKALAGIFSASEIVNADIDANAQIDAFKIYDGTVGNLPFSYLANVTSDIQAQLNAISGGAITSLTGMVTATGPGAAPATIANNVITNAMVNAAAAIAYSKLALSNSIVNADIAAGAAIAYTKLALTGSIVNTDISASAAIAYSKLNLALSIVNADISASAAIAYSKLALTGSILNADISASAAIAFSKLAALPSANILVGSAGNVATATAVTGDVTISNAGVTAIGAAKVTNAMLAGSIDLTTKVTGALPIANGGTGQTTKTDAFDALAPTTTKGDLIVHNGTDNIRVAVGANGTVLTADSGQTSGYTFTSPLINPMTTAGDLIYGGVAGAATRLAAGTTGQMLTGGTTPVWGNTIVSWTLTGGSAADLSAWVASNVLRLRGGSSGFAVDNTSATPILSASNTGAWTLGPASSALTHTFNAAAINQSSTGAAVYNILSASGSSGVAFGVNGGAVSGFAGVAGSANTPVSGGAVGDFYHYLSTKAFIFSIDNGASIHFKIDSAGAVAIGKTGSTAGHTMVGNSIDIALSGTSAWSKSNLTGAGSSTFNQYRDGSGNIVGSIVLTFATSTAYNTTSDARLKTNPSDFDALEKISSMIPREFEFTRDETKTRQYGFYAQELDTVFPQAVSRGSDEIDEDGNLTNPWGIDSSKIVPVLVRAMQQQQQMIETLKARIEALEV